MWTKNYSKKLENVSAEKIWKAWTDVNHWHTWQDDIDFAKLEGEMALGKKISFRPKGGPTLNLEINEFVDNKIFTDMTRLPLAKMYDRHEIIKDGNSVEVRTTISIEGPLSFIWKKIIAENIVKGLEAQTDRLIEHSKSI